jgi:DNA-binding response OmpR family regulator
VGDALADKPGEAAAAHGGPRGHVLVVEDNDVVSSALRALFEQTGRRVSVAATIADAVHSAGADHPDLILLDLTLPDGSGLDIVAQLRSGVSPPIVVALTGRDEPAVTQRCAELGCAEVLLKPVPARELLRLAARWLEAPQ